jgi:hypothetical protein
MRKLLASLALGLAVLGFSATSFAADDAASAPAVAAATASAPAADASAPAAAAPASAAASTPTIVETVNKGDTTWMLVSTALVIMMSIPALALFYGGLVRSKNMLSVLMQVFVTFSLITSSSGSSTATAWRSPKATVHRRLQSAVPERHVRSERRHVHQGRHVRARRDDPR